MDKNLCTLLLLVASVGYAQDPLSTCKTFAKTLVCQEKMPQKEDIDETIDNLIVVNLPEGTWLSSADDPSASDTSALQKIDIRNSFIEKIDSGYFSTLTGPNKLKKLTLRAVGGSVEVNKDMLQGLTKSLTQLNVLSKIRVDLDAISELTVLSELELVTTNIFGNPSSFVKILKNLRSLSISHTNLKTLPWDEMAKWVEEDKTRSLSISANEWNCDCSISVLKQLSSSLSQQSLQSLKCSGPGKLKDRSLADISPEELCPYLPPPSAEEVVGSDTGKGTAGQGGSSGDSADLTVAGSGGGKGVEDGSKTNMIIAGVVVGAIILAFVIFIIAYKLRLSSKKKNNNGGSLHQNTKYVSVIERPLREQPRNSANIKFSHGQRASGSQV